MHFLGMNRRFHWEASIMCAAKPTSDVVDAAKKAACASLDFAKQPMMQRAREFFYYTIGQ